MGEKQRRTEVTEKDRKREKEKSRRTRNEERRTKLNEPAELVGIGSEGQQRERETDNIKKEKGGGNTITARERASRGSR